MPKGGNGGGGKPGGNDGGETTVRWRGSRRNDTIYIVDDGAENGNDAFSVDQFLAGSFDGRGGIDTLDFSGLTSDGIHLRLSHTQTTVSFEQSYLGYYQDFLTADPASFVPSDFVGFEQIIATAGDDSISGPASGISVIDGGAGDDRIRVISGSGSVIVGGTGSDQLGGYNDSIYVGGTWDGTYSAQSGDGEVDLFVQAGVILDFDLPAGTFSGDQLVVAGGIDSSNASAIEDVLALEFREGTWTDPDGVEHQAAIYPYIGGTGEMFTLVGVSAEDANALILPTIRFDIGTGEAGFMLRGSSNDDWFTLTDDGDSVLFELDGGNDTLIYNEFTDPSDDTLYFEGEAPAPEDWTYSNTDGVDVWTTNYNGQIITILGLDQAGFDSLTFETIAFG